MGVNIFFSDFQNIVPPHVLYDHSLIGAMFHGILRRVFLLSVIPDLPAKAMDLEMVNGYVQIAFAPTLNDLTKKLFEFGRAVK